MKPSSFQSSSLLPLFIILLSILSLLSCTSSYYEPYYKCAPFSCGNITNIRYPFWGNGQPEYCGQPGFRIDCEEEIVTLDIMNLKYHVIEINPDTQILRIARIDLSNSICPAQYFNTTLNFTLFNYTSNDENATLFYNCNLSENQETNKFTCFMNNVQQEAYLDSPSISRKGFELGCNVGIVIPILARAVVGFLQSEMSVVQVLNEGFEVRWIIDQMKCGNCARSGGRCEYNWTVNQFSCFCPDEAACVDVYWPDHPTS